MPDAENVSAPASPLAPALFESSAVETGEAATGEAATEEAVTEDASAWRDEVATRLNRYRARRKPRPPRYPSLQLRFDPPEEPARDTDRDISHAPVFETVSNHALALDTLEFDTPTEAPSAQSAAHTLRQPAAPDTFAAGTGAGSNGAGTSGAKILEFPRSLTFSPPVPLDELAGPVLDRPRILEAPELVPPPPALGGITIDTDQTKEIEKRPGIDVPLQSAPLARRMVATAIDALIVVAASAIFGAIFWKVTAFRPPTFQILGLAIGVPCLLWAAFQYLLIVYGASTPGLRLAELELARFDGTPANRSLRRWRVLASYLSAVSLGMGYAWVFLDEDALCWHDRATHTYLAPRKPQPKPEELSTS
jgi:uncharacterized RDD family membrane protein YckC